MIKAYDLTPSGGKNSIKGKMEGVSISHHK